MCCEPACDSVIGAMWGTVALGVLLMCVRTTPADTRYVGTHLLLCVRTIPADTR